MAAVETTLTRFLRVIALGDATTARRLLAESPALASAQVEVGASRSASTEWFLVEVGHYMYAGDTALHVAAAGYRSDLARRLVTAGADVRATNRRGAQPLHYAADGGPGAAHWNPEEQAAIIAYLIGAGAEPDAADRNGATPLHRAVRTRCAAAVAALLDGGADAGRRNRSGSTPLMLARHNTGRGGTGSIEAKEQQRQIVDRLEQSIATT